MSAAEARQPQPIAELLAEANRVNRETGKAFVYANAYKRHREAWVLGHFAALYNAWSERRADLVLAEPGETADVPADFAAYDAAGAPVAHIEVSTALDPGRRPGAEYRDPNRPRVEFIPDPDDTGVDPWGHLREVLGQKVHKARTRYASGTWLVVYLSVFASMYGEEGDPVDAAEAAIASFSPAELGLAEVWLLDGAKLAHRVYPTRVTLRAPGSGRE